MSLQFIVNNVLPFLLVLIMFGLGLSLTVSDFKRLRLYPRAVLIALICQLILIPLIAFGLCFVFQLPAALAVGLVLLAATPCGPTSNMYTKISGGDLPLNLSTTAILTVLSPVVLPFYAQLAIAVFDWQNHELGLQTAKLAEIFLLMLVPISIGMFLHAKRPLWSARLEPPVKTLSVVSLGFLLIVAILKERDNIAAQLSAVGAAVLAFNFLSLAIGYWFPRLLGLTRSQSIAISFQLGIHSAGLALVIALSVLQSSEVAAPATLYSVIMYITAGLLSFIIKSRLIRGI
jgi:BASS family bile acid:Na+ symporter